MGEVVPTPDDWLDGIPVFVERSGEQRSDQVVLGLVFRVGVADERLPIRGISHLSEHLTLSGFDLNGRFNGMVDALTTTFVVAGTPSEVTEHLGRLCSAIAQPDLSRLAIESDILRAEAARGGPGLMAEALSRRIGVRDYGLHSYREMFLEQPDASALASWIATHLTAGNAALWCHGPLPDGLRLPLPPGPRNPVPNPTWLPATYPAWTDVELGGVALDVIARYDVRLIVSLQVLRTRLLDRLRTRDGASYAVELEVDSFAGGHLLHAFVRADCLPERLEQVRDAMVTEVSRLCRGGATDGEVASVVADLSRSIEEAPEAGTPAASRARCHLFGVPDVDVAAHLPRIQAMDPAAVGADLRELMSSAVWMVPGSVGWHDQRSQHLLPWSTDRIPGAAYPIAVPSADDDRRALVAGDAGLTMQFGSEHRISTVRFDSCAAVLAFPDGRRHLIGDDGFTVLIDPERWTDGQRLVAWIDQRVPSDRIVRMRP